jgi:hypothetical protein
MRELEKLEGVVAVYKAPSSSRAGLFHITMVFDNNEVDCTCEGWRMNRKCWHTEIALGGDADEGGLGGFSVSL